MSVIHTLKAIFCKRSEVGIFLMDGVQAGIQCVFLEIFSGVVLPKNKVNLVENAHCNDVTSV